MKAAEQRIRLKQLASALQEVERMDKYSVADSIKRTLRILELCPWLSEDDLCKSRIQKPSSRSAKRHGANGAASLTARASTPTT
jgi:hypothetical protein